MTVAVSTTVIVAPMTSAAATEDTQPGASQPAAVGWQSAQPSVTADPTTLVQDIGATEKAHVVVLSDDGGQLTVDTVSARGDEAALDAVADAQSRPGVLAVGVDHQVHATADPLQYRQWGLTKVQASRAWQVTRGAGSVVAVVDSGVDGSHPDLAGSLVRGVNTRTDRGDYSAPTVDRDGHGTHVAGIIAARAGNGKGVVGVAPAASIMPVKVLDADGSGWMGDVVEGIVWAADHGADVINMSLGGPDADFSATAVAYARSKGVTVVAAAGNESSSAPSYPAALPGVISVSALARDGVVDTYSNYGSTIDVAAPGSGILSTVPDGYGFMTGTSMASPQVAGIAALVEAVAPRADVEAIVKKSADDAGASGWDARYGAGVVDAFAAVRMACPSCSVRSLPSGLATAQSVGVPSQVKVGKSKALRSLTDQGAPVTTWRSLSPKRCSVNRSASAFRVVGKAKGLCLLQVSVAATGDLAALNRSYTVRVTGR